ncbi:putative 3-isopropylmalate dehydrogenase [Helianthus anomalus]
MLFTMLKLRVEIEYLLNTKLTSCKIPMVYFLKCWWEVAEKYPKIKYEEVVIDNCCMTVHPFILSKYDYYKTHYFIFLYMKPGKESTTI